MSTLCHNGLISAFCDDKDEHTDDTSHACEIAEFT